MCLNVLALLVLNDCALLCCMTWCDLVLLCVGMCLKMLCMCCYFVSVETDVGQVWILFWFTCLWIWLWLTWHLLFVCCCMTLNNFVNAALNDFVCGIYGFNDVVSGIVWVWKRVHDVHMLKHDLFSNAVNWSCMTCWKVVAWFVVWLCVEWALCLVCWCKVLNDCECFCEWLWKHAWLVVWVDGFEILFIGFVWFRKLCVCECPRRETTLYMIRQMMLHIFVWNTFAWFCNYDVKMICVTCRIMSHLYEFVVRIWLFIVICTYGVYDCVCVVYNFACVYTEFVYDCFNTFLCCMIVDCV